MKRMLNVGLFVLALGMLLVGCASMKENTAAIRALPVNTEAPETVQEAQRLIRVGHAQIVKWSSVAEGHKAAGLITEERADYYADKLEEFRRGLVEARRLIKAGFLLQSKDLRQVQEKLLDALIAEMEREVAEAMKAKEGA